MYTILLWFPLFLLYMASASGVDEKCIKGQYKSDFVGGCVKCPKTLKQCEEQEIDDSYRYSKACEQVFSTLQPIQNLTTTQQVHTSSVAPTPITLTTKASEIKKKLPTQLPEALSKGYPVYEKFKTTLAVHSSSIDSLDRYSGDSKTSQSGKVGGITVGTVAFMLLVAGIFAISWTKMKGSTRKNHQQEIDYTAVRLGSQSYSNGNDIKLEKLKKSDAQLDEEDDKSLWTITSVSRENLEKMPELHV